MLPFQTGRVVVVVVIGVLTTRTLAGDTLGTSHTLPLLVRQTSFWCVCVVDLHVAGDLPPPHIPRQFVPIHFDTSCQNTSHRMERHQCLHYNAASVISKSKPTLFRVINHPPVLIVYWTLFVLRVCLLLPPASTNPSSLPSHKNIIHSLVEVKMETNY